VTRVVTVTFSMNLQPLRDYLDSKDIRGRAIVLFLDSQAKNLTQDTVVQTGIVTAVEYRCLEALFCVVF
jgi:hypothetical protein